MSRKFCESCGKQTTDRLRLHFDFDVGKPTYLCPSIHVCVGCRDLYKQARVRVARANRAYKQAMKDAQRKRDLEQWRH